MSLSVAMKAARGALQANATSTGVVSRNIAGVNDPAYSRKIASLITTDGPVRVVVSRASDTLLFDKTLRSTSELAGRTEILKGLISLEDTVGDTEAGRSVSAKIGAVKVALANAANQPNDINLAKAAVAAAKDLARPLNQASATIQKTRLTADQDIAKSVGTINDLLGQFDKANKAVVFGTATGADISDALDNRDKSRDDVGRMAAVLKDAGVPFDVSSDGTALLVSYGQTAQARMLLAEKGLPQSGKAGYELFNDLGSLGLTSFMQDITRVRALEGEIARTVQTLKGVKAARVHIVMPDPGSFRREQQPASASVVVRTEPANDPSTAPAIRQLVAAAIPGMKPDKVTVLNTDGTILLSGDDATTAPAGRMATLEQLTNREIQDNIRRTLTPYLGTNNFEVSVVARLNTDKTQTNETLFNPDQKVERGTRVIKETENSQNRTAQRPTTAQQNLPNQNVQSGGGENSTSESQRREEQTNYEISSKTIQTVSDGYSVKNLSVAVLVNRSRLEALANPGGKDTGTIELEPRTCTRPCRPSWRTTARERSR